MQGRRCTGSHMQGRRCTRGERFGQHYRRHNCTPMPFAVNSQTPSTASDRQEDNFPPTASRPTEDLPQRLSYSRAVQQASDDTDRKRRECEERWIKLERASEAHDCRFEKIKRDQKSLNLVMSNIPEEGERARRTGSRHSKEPEHRAQYCS